MSRILRMVLLAGLLACNLAAADPLEEPAEAILDRVVAQLAVDRSQVQITGCEDLALPGPVSAYRFEFGSIPRGRTLVRCHSEAHRDYTFTIDVRVWDSAWVATCKVARGEALSAGQFSRSWLDVTELVPCTDATLAGLRARRTLQPGTLLLADAVEPLPLIARGSAVTLEATSGAIKVSRQGVALGDALKGEIVRVRVDAHTVISATATGPDLCVVGF